MLRISADWVLPIDSGPIANGTILIGDDGRIAAVGADHLIPRPTDAESEVFPGAVLMPGLVNTHTHLELTGFAGQVDEPDFWQWIQKVIAIKSARPEEEFFDAACRGIREQWAAGVTTICDTGSTGAVLEALAHLKASGCSHHEVFGSHPDQCESAMSLFSGDLDRLAHLATGRATLGVSPHSPYSVSGDLYRASCELARAHGVPIAVHVAEPADESSLLNDFTGIFADHWKAKGIPRPSASPQTPIEFMDRHGVLSDRTLCIHAIDVSEGDIEVMQRRAVAVAHCPRSNRHHHGADSPVRQYLDAGLRLGLGTDSEVSVAPLDLFAEARSAQKLASWTDREALRAMTVDGANAIDRASDSGSLAIGKWADLAAIRVGETNIPESSVLASGPDDILCTWLGGSEVHRTAT